MSVIVQSTYTGTYLRIVVVFTTAVYLPLLFIVGLQKTHSPSPRIISMRWLLCLSLWHKFIVSYYYKSQIPTSFSFYCCLHFYVHVHSLYALVNNQWMGGSEIDFGFNILTIPVFAALTKMKSSCHSNVKHRNKVLVSESSAILFW